MKSKYIAASHSFQEQPEMQRPADYLADFDRTEWNEQWTRYNEHLSTLRLISCRPGDRWQEGVLYEEGKDYEVYHYSDENRVNKMEIIPVAPTTEQTELWREVLSYTAEQHSKIAIEIADQKWNAATAIVNTIYKFLLERYTISLRSEQPTRKQEVPEAVEFANWCVDLYQWSDTEEIWVDNQGEKYSTAELFQLFKTPTNAPAHPH